MYGNFFYSTLDQHSSQKYKKSFFRKIQEIFSWKVFINFMFGFEKCAMWLQFPLLKMKFVSIKSRMTSP